MKRFKDHIKLSSSKCGIPRRAVCDKGLETFEQQHIDVAEAAGVRLYSVAVLAAQPSDYKEPHGRHKERG